MLEIEVKYAGADLDAIRAKLRAQQATFDAVRTDVDQYFNAPDRDFGKTDEALRLRSIGDRNFITYKGPKTDLQTKTRTELEVGFQPGQPAAVLMAALLTNLGYRLTATVHKQREVAHWQRGGFAMEVCLDNVEQVGQFVELEIVAPPEQLEAARAVVLRTAAELGLTQSERRSYLEMLLKQRNRP